MPVGASASLVESDLRAKSPLSHASSPQRAVPQWLHTRRAAKILSGIERPLCKPLRNHAGDRSGPLRAKRSRRNQASDGQWPLPEPSSANTCLRVPRAKRKAQLRLSLNVALRVSNIKSNFISAAPRKPVCHVIVDRRGKHAKT